ncbi:MAG: hypothetical protein IJ057_08055 [Bacteroidales bacterium]|nr:hypothetical protein [Bacteroidales bacterium]
MKKLSYYLMLAAAVAALAALLLTRCHEGNPKGHSSQKNNEIQTSVSIDTSTLAEGF